MPFPEVRYRPEAERRSTAGRPIGDLLLRRFVDIFGRYQLDGTRVDTTGRIDYELERDNAHIVGQSAMI